MPPPQPPAQERAAIPVPSPDLSRAGTSAASGRVADRGHLLTEQPHAASALLDRMTTGEILRLMHAEDARAVQAVGDALSQGEAAALLVLRALVRGGRLIYVGAGTSGRLGVLDAAECPPTFSVPADLVQGVIAGGPEALVRAREGAEDDPAAGFAALRERGVAGLDAVVGITAGGTTPFVAGALEAARAAGASTALVTCVPDAPLAGLADVTVAVLVGPEILTGSTRLKAGTATKLVLNMLTTSAMVGLGKVYGNRMVDLQVTAAKLEDRGRRILREFLGIADDEAGALLAGAGGNVKTALVMARRRVDRQTALRLLQERAGFVRDLLA
ncbi:MAG: N-acetylmuramic acid 6-phosphate etherase [Gemmatimonadetes bacterium]|nr:N-acetylmuramic acid 6-phosphate etherase [Gemmatimonadota bacterium]